MKVNNSTVHDIVQEALDNHHNGKLTNRLYDAFLDVRVEREKRCLNLDWAAAEHYLFSRWLVNRCSPLIAAPFLSAIWLYDGIYKAANEATKKIGVKIVIETGKCPPTEFSPVVLAWALTGVSDAGLDCATLTVFEDSPEIYAPNYPLLYYHRLFGN